MQVTQSKLLRIFVLTAATAAFKVALLSSCQKEFSGPALINTAPIVFAGNDTSVISYDFNLNGEIEDKESDVKTIQWSQHSSIAPAYLVSPASASTPAVFTQDGIYQFILTATDAAGLTDSDTVRISVILPIVQVLRDSVIVDSIPWTYDPKCAIVVHDIDKLLPQNKDIQIRLWTVGLSTSFGPVIPEKNSVSNSNDAHYIIQNNTIEIYLPTIDCNFDVYEYFDVSISWER